MLVKCSVDTLEFENISHSVTLVPRLDYSINLLTGIIDVLEKQRTDLKNLNRHLVTDFDEMDNSHVKSIRLEQLIVFSLDVLFEIKNQIGSISDVLFEIKNQIGSISGIHSIPKILPSSIPMIRTVSAKLFVISPISSQKLSELSVHLGSIVLDSAALTKARFDFSKCNDRSATLLDEVKLMADSKLNKQYPLVDFFKLSNV